jgi:ethanolamine utilization cobalamin adenosyltransferase
MTAAKTPIYAVPTNDEEEAALQKALATRHLQKLEAAQALFDGEPYVAFRTGLDTLITSNLPLGSATRQNAENLARFLDTMIRGVEQDVQGAEAAVNPAPPPPEVPAPAMPVI